MEEVHILIVLPLTRWMPIKLFVFSATIILRAYFRRQMEVQHGQTFLEILNKIQQQEMEMVRHADGPLSFTLIIFTELFWRPQRVFIQPHYSTGIKLSGFHRALTILVIIHAT